MAVMALVSSGCQPYQPYQPADQRMPDYGIQPSYGESKIELEYRGLDIHVYKAKGKTEDGKPFEKIITVNINNGEIRESTQVEQ